MPPDPLADCSRPSSTCDSEIEFGVMNSLLGVPCESRTSTGTGKQIEESGSIANLARTLGSTRSECDWIRASAPVLASNSRPRARYRHPFPSYLSRAIPSPAHASSAIAWSVSSASHIRQSRPPPNLRATSRPAHRRRSTPRPKVRECILPILDP